MARRHQRGLTLLEAVLAMAVFSTGVAALFGMITNVSQANRSMAFQNNALDLYTMIAAQVRDAQCEYDGNVPPVFTPPMTDQGLTIGPVHGGPAGPTPNSGITAVGDIASNPAVFGEYVPRMIASYVVTNTTPPPPRPGADPPPPQLNIAVTIREFMNDPVKDAAPIGAWVRTYPIEKVCAARYDNALPRGAFR